MYSNMPIKQWLAEEYPKLPKERKPMECMQRGGDIIFVPELWGHGTYTVQESIGVAIEFQGADRYFFDTLFFPIFWSNKD